MTGERRLTDEGSGEERQIKGEIRQMMKGDEKIDG